MNLNNNDKHTFNTTNSSKLEPYNKSDLVDNFSENKDSEIIEKEYESLSKNIESIIRANFLNKEFYENHPDWWNTEIDNICSYSASDIENRIKEWKWILYMNPCISQTLYFISKLKKEFPHLSKNTVLRIETLKLSKLNIRSVHAFIQINTPNREPMIIDYAHDNDVYIYQWEYSNRSKLAIKTESIRNGIPINSFSDEDNIFNIVSESKEIEEWDFDMLNSRITQLKKHNTKTKFEHWQEKNKEIRIFNLLRS